LLGKAWYDYGTEAVRMPSDRVNFMLRKELKEINTWTRLVTQIYFTWYAVFLTVSAAALTWAVNKNATGVDHLSMKYGMAMFALWSLLGVLVTIPVLVYSKHSHRRIEEIHQMILRDELDAATIRSPIPLVLFNFAYSCTGTALLAMVVVWSRLFWAVHSN
jgi:hypothetical protein